MTPTRPILRYHGGKFRLADWIISAMPPHEHYVEPFGGGFSVGLRKPPCPIEVYNDIDTHVVNLMRVLRFPPRAEELRRQVSLTLFSRTEYEDAYDSADADPVENARRLVLRMFQSLGNKSRTQRSGWRTRTAKSRISPCLAWNGWPEHMPELVERLRHKFIEELDWRKILPLYDDGNTLFYCDPPYPASTRTRNHKRMYAEEMSLVDHAELLDALMKLRGMVIVSTYPNDLYDEALHGWLRLETQARAQTNAPRTEVIYLNPLAASRMPHPTIFQEEHDA